MEYSHDSDGALLIENLRLQAREEASIIGLLDGIAPLLIIGDVQSQHELVKYSVDDLIYIYIFVIHQAHLNYDH